MFFFISRHKIIRAFPATKSQADFISSLEFNPDIEVSVCQAVCQVGVWNGA